MLTSQKISIRGVPVLAKRITSKVFSDKPTATYICPACKTGQLSPVASTFHKSEPTFSGQSHAHPDWDPYWIEYRFSFRCVCNNSSCGETANAAGDGGVDQRYDFDGVPEYYDYFRIRSFFPAPYLIEVPVEIPSKVREMLERSFALYWVDPSSAANAVRASLEFLLDELEIPRRQISSQEKTVRLSLHQRIVLAEAQEPEFSELFLALKDVGNVGSHGGDVSVGDYTDALEIFSHVLRRLYEDDSKRIKMLALKLRDQMKNKQT